MGMVTWGLVALGLSGAFSGAPVTTSLSHDEPIIAASEESTSASAIVEGDGCTACAVDHSCDACLEAKPGLLSRIAGRFHSFKSSLHLNSCTCESACTCGDPCTAPRIGLLARLKGALHPPKCGYACDDICGIKEGDVFEGDIADAIPSEVESTSSSKAPCPSCGHYIQPSKTSTVIQPAPEAPASKPSVNVATEPSDTKMSTSPVIGRKRDSLTPVPIDTPVTIQQMSAVVPTLPPTPLHASDFSWVQGELQYAHVRGGMWIIRYLPLHETDRNGGSVVLATDGRLENFHEGDIVRVSGEIVRSRSESSLGGPLYRIRSITLVHQAASK